MRQECAMDVSLKADKGNSQDDTTKPIVNAPNGNVMVPDNAGLYENGGMSNSLKQKIITRTIFFLFNIGEIVTPVIAQYALSKAARIRKVSEFMGLNGLDAEDVCRNASLQTNITSSLLWQEAEDEATSVVMVTGILCLLPNIFVVLILGAVSDAKGTRVFNMFIPILGRTLYAFFILMDYYIEMKNFSLIYIGSLLTGLTGGKVTFFSACSAYIAETVSLEARTAELSILQIFNGIGLAVGNVVAGYWISGYGYEGPFWLIFILVLIGSLLCLNIQEPHPTEQVGFSQFKSRIKDIFCFTWCSSEISGPLLCYFFALGFYSCIHVSGERLNTLFLETLPLCFDNITIGWWLFFSGMVMALGTFLLPIIGTRFLDDTGLANVGFVSRAAATLCLAFANTKTIAFLSIPFMIFQTMPIPAFRAMASKLVFDGQYGTLFAFMHFVQCIFMFAGPLALTIVFNATAVTFHSAIYVVCLFVLIIPVLLTGLGKILEKRLRFSGYTNIDRD